MLVDMLHECERPICMTHSAQYGTGRWPYGLGEMALDPLRGPHRSTPEEGPNTVPECTQAAAQWMKDNGEGGRLINTSSTSGLLGNFGQSNYGSAKAGIAGFTRIAALEFERYGITVNAVAPIVAPRP